MIRKEALNKLPEYLDGGLSPRERTELEAIMSADLELQSAARELHQIDSLLTTQVRIEPGPEFTNLVMHRVTMLSSPCVETRRARWTDRVLTATPFAAAVGVLGYHARTLGGLALEYLKDAGMWLNATTGWSVFATYPVVILGLIAPLMAGAVASCALSGRCKLTSA